MSYLVLPFKVVSLIFAVSAIATGAQAIIDPGGFSRLFGIPLASITSTTTSQQSSNALSFASLMGVRQLATGLTLSIFAYQGKWTEIATILVILGVVVACTDGVYLYRAGNAGGARWHAIPGLVIATLAAHMLQLSSFTVLD